MKQYIASQLGTSELFEKVSGGTPIDENAQNIVLKVDGSGPGGLPQIGDAVTVTIQARTTRSPRSGSVSGTSRSPASRRCASSRPLRG